MNIFLTGTGRCGTTILSEILSRDSNILNLGETHLFHEYTTFLKTIRRRCIKGIIKNTNDNSIKLVNRLLTLNVTETYMIQAMSEFINSVIMGLCIAYGKIATMDKTPHNLKITELLQEVYDDPYFIHIVRDPLDVFSSFKYREWAIKDVRAFIKWYSNFMDVSLNQWNKLQNRKVIIFEDFCKEPELTITDICKFLDLPILNIGSFDATKSHVGRYKYDLSQKEIDLINDKCQKFYLKWKELV